jgi:hypothetical protein
VVADGGGLTLLFTQQGANFFVRVGGILEDTYRIDNIDPQQVIITNLQRGNVISVPYTSIIASDMPPIPFRAPALETRRAPAAALVSNAKQAAVTGAPSALAPMGRSGRSMAGRRVRRGAKADVEAAGECLADAGEIRSEVMEWLLCGPALRCRMRRRATSATPSRPTARYRSTRAIRFTAPLAGAPVVEVTFRP